MQLQENPRGSGYRSIPSPAQVDFHIHTILSACASGEMTVRNIAERCELLRRKVIGLTDHILRPEHVACIVEDVDEVRSMRMDSLALCVGCELDMSWPGRTAAEAGKELPVDYVAVATNHFHLDTVRKPASDRPKALAAYWAELALSLADLPRADVWVHPAHVGPYEGRLGERTLLSLLTARRRDDLFRSLKEAGVAVELRRLPAQPDRVASHIEFYREARKAGLKFSVGSDAHHLSTLSDAWEGISGLARQTGFGASDMWLPKCYRESFGNPAEAPGEQTASP